MALSQWWWWWRYWQNANECENSRILRRQRTLFHRWANKRSLSIGKAAKEENSCTQFHYAQKHVPFLMCVCVSAMFQKDTEFYLFYRINIWRRLRAIDNNAHCCDLVLLSRYCFTHTQNRCASGFENKKTNCVQTWKLNLLHFCCWLISLSQLLGEGKQQKNILWKNSQQFIYCFPNKSSRFRFSSFLLRFIVVLVERRFDITSMKIEEKYNNFSYLVDARALASVQRIRSVVHCFPFSADSFFLSILFMQL